MVKLIHSAEVGFPYNMLLTAVDYLFWKLNRYLFTLIKAATKHYVLRYLFIRITEFL